MSTSSPPKIDTEGLPVAHERDEAWKTLAKCPIVEVGGAYALTDRRLVERALKAPTIFSSKKAFDLMGSPVPMVPIAFDPPQQTKYRQILQPFFSPAAVRPLEPSLRAQAAALIEPIVQNGGGDFVAEFGKVFPVQVFLTLFGLPLEMRDTLIGWKDAMLGLTTSSGGQNPDQAAAEEMLKKAFDLFTYLTDVIKQRRGHEGDDVLTQIVNLEQSKGLNDEELVGLSILLVLAGLDTVTDALGMGMQRLAENPDRRQEILDDPSLIRAAVEELLRLDPPAPFLPRVSTEAVEIGGFEMPAETTVSAYLSTANRDETLFPDPHTINFRRPSNQHVTFGTGVHRCLGSHLARLEMNIALEEWHKVAPHYHVTPGTHPRIHWPSSLISLEALHLTIGR